MKESNVQTELNVSGMHCANCAISIHQYLENNGAKDIYVDFASDEVKFSEIPLEQIPVLVKGIESLGYKVIGDKDKKPSFWKSIEFKFLCCLIFTIPLWSHMFTELSVLHDPYIQLALCAPVYLIGFSYFGISAFRSIWNKMPNMDVLIFIGSTAAFIYSLIGTYYHLGHDYQFYETCATIITLVFLGNVLEKRAVTKTTSAIKELVKYQDIPAIKIEDDQEVEILAKEIKSGDILKVNTGNQIPADGDIVDGQAWVDESMLTGESVPVEKIKYDSVIGGTLLTEGNIRIIATKVGSKSVLYQIIQLIKDAQSKKPPIQKFGDKVAAYFVPIVVTISFFTFFITYFIAQLPLQQSLMNAIATLVVSCPCAMGLATPTAVMVGLGRAAKKGILIKGGSTIEEMSDLKQMVFDKTGTLTTGDFNIKAIQTFGIEQSQVESIIAQLESYSSHPIAKSIRKQLKEIKSYRIIFQEVNEIRGKGIFATDTNGNSYSICNAKLGEKDYSNRYDLTLTINSVVIAGIVLEDQIKPYAKELIQYLKDKGIRPILLSGDRQSKCERTAQKLGIADVYWDKSPEEKLEILFKLKKNGPTAMVGDGINDAPALTAADVGISLGDSTHIAIQSAKVVLLNNDLRSIEKLLKIGHHTLLTIKQNLFWAFAYNIVAIPLAAIGFLGPMLAALSMAFSDLVVIGNSIRLRFKKMK
ncbi:MAG: cadmium-translocating P-type ATPase [Sphingobacterium sp.]|jgi:Cu+-exporting ATPase|uniref:heavy metal translocating P-type ATPase n=1 Tax=Sphingobacterium sp. TaxID=341027 RepID=UPI0028486ABA|nr:cation-translocating P-type ATPase [Sphingobacterium sp.]MDR3010462.1 cadmium-translocating P-type ATPase [Sphingobacterium sp.]